MYICTVKVNLLFNPNLFDMNIFQQITDYVKRDYSTFDMKNNWLGSINGFGSLNAIYHSTVLPGDTWKMSHNVMVKLPPLISPAFTRIKGIVNSYYCSYASVWNYWNSFISDKPEDVFLSRSLTASYKGKFVEPCCRMGLIALICKFAYGFFDALPSSSSEIAFNYTTGTPNTLKIDYRPLYQAYPPSTTPSPVTPTTIVWGYNSSGLRFVTLAPTTSSYDATGDQFWHDDITRSITFVDFGLNATETPFKLGFADFKSYFIYQCQECARNLSNHGVPVELIARTNLSFYQADYFNLLPFIAESSIWHNFYRDEQNQSPEFDYREVNGCICSPNLFGGSSDSSMPYGWRLRLLGIPPNESVSSTYWLRVFGSVERPVWSIMTGFLLEETVRNYATGTSGTDIAILPKFYNGLLCLKYRNFEKDYFTSASVDPNYGGVSVQVPNTIDALRTASKLEEFLEVSASARDFYNFMKHIFGTNPESTRYNKPLLLGTQVIPIQIGEQLQTSQTTTGVGGSPLGDRAGVADGYGNSGTVNHYFNEHGIVVSFLSFVIDSQYMQGMPHEFNHHLQLDYPFPQFANLGAESIATKEIYYSNQAVGIPYSYADGDNNAVVDRTSYVQNRVDSPVMTTAAPDVPLNLEHGTEIGYSVVGTPPRTQAVAMEYYSQSGSPYSVFGYTPRYSKWKFKMDVVAGQLRDDLEYWHTFRHFSSIPFISNAFVSYMNAGYLSNLNRIFAVDNDNSDKFVCDIFNNASVRRCLPLIPQTTID